MADTLAKHRTVLESPIPWADDSDPAIPPEERPVLVTFATRTDDGPRLVSPRWTMVRRDFLDMGSPTHITVTIEPGDLLNEEAI